MTSRRRRFNSRGCFKGVWYDKSRQAYRAYLTIDGKRKHLGWFTDELNAALAVDTATRVKYGGAGKYNLPLPGEDAAI